MLILELEESRKVKDDGKYENNHGLDFAVIEPIRETACRGEFHKPVYGHGHRGVDGTGHQHVGRRQQVGGDVG